jgi:hypothetical protein
MRVYPQTFRHFLASGVTVLGDLTNPSSNLTLPLNVNDTVTPYAGPVRRVSRILCGTEITDALLSNRALPRATGLTATPSCSSPSPPTLSSQETSPTRRERRLRKTDTGTLPNTYSRPAFRARTPPRSLPSKTASLRPACRSLARARSTRLACRPLRLSLLRLPAPPRVPRRLARANLAMRPLCASSPLASCSAPSA